MALQDLGILQYLPLRVKAIFIFVQKTTANVKVSCLLTPCTHARSTTRTGTVFWQLKTANLIYAGKSHGYMNALEFMKEDRTGNLITGTNTYTIEITYIGGTEDQQKGFKNFGFTNLNI